MSVSPLAGQPAPASMRVNVQRVLTHAPGNGAPIDSVKVEAASAWFAARPSGTEDVYKIYAGSFSGADHLRRILAEAQSIVGAALAAPAQQEIDLIAQSGKGVTHE